MHGFADGAGIRRRIRESISFLLPSSAEGLPVAIMEAMAQHRSVINTFLAAIPVLARPGFEGWLAPSSDASAKRVLERHNDRVSAQLIAGFFHQYSEELSA
jgi:glycosyltransferase involved in cell wall biosynthesis